MKNLRVILLVVALISLAYVLVPCDAMAQEGGDGPCCFNSPIESAQLSDSLSLELMQSPYVSSFIFSQPTAAVENQSVMVAVETRKTWR
jgi:hypothetical protein